MDNSVSQKQQWWARVLPGRATGEGVTGNGKPEAMQMVVIGLFSVVAIVLATALFIGVFLVPYKGIQQMAFSASALPQVSAALADSAMLSDRYTSASKDMEIYSKKLAAYMPQKPYIIINTTTNTFRLCKGDEVIRAGNCSTGSYVKLRGKGNREWIFKTPKGYHTIKNRTTNPVWKKPDWAFVEEGLPVPSPNHPSRFEYGVLGDYAMYMGEGYMIHGTLYQRLLGLPVTHGCIRLGDADLEVVFKNLGTNSKVFIL